MQSRGRVETPQSLPSRRSESNVDTHQQLLEASSAKVEDLQEELRVVRKQLESREKKKSRANDDDQLAERVVKKLKPELANLKHKPSAGVSVAQFDKHAKDISGQIADLRGDLLKKPGAMKAPKAPGAGKATKATAEEPVDPPLFLQMSEKFRQAQEKTVSSFLKMQQEMHGQQMYLQADNFSVFAQAMSKNSPSPLDTAVNKMGLQTRNDVWDFETTVELDEQLKLHGPEAGEMFALNPQEVGAIRAHFRKRAKRQKTMHGLETAAAEGSEE
mgnify:CR=1 FL=1